MTEWWSYRLEDFLLFSPRVYWRMFELGNAQFWPLHILTLAAGFAIVLLLQRQPRGHGSWIALILAVLWIFVAWSFLWNRYATINWAITYAVPAFGVQALLLMTVAKGGFRFVRTGIAAWVGRIVVILGVALYPLLPPLFGRPWTNAEVFGIAPDPTVVATLGILVTASGRLPLLLMPIPLLWLLASGLTLNTMGDPQGWIPFLTLVAAIVVLLPPFRPTVVPRPD